MAAVTFVSAFCVEALDEELGAYPAPGICNTDLGSRGAGSAARRAQKLTRALLLRRRVRTRTPGVGGNRVERRDDRNDSLLQYRRRHESRGAECILNLPISCPNNRYHLKM